MIRTDDKKLCSGCGTCGLVCPKECISYSNKDVLGHLYAEVDDEKCVGCGACVAVCPLQKTFSRKCFGQRAYATYSSDRAVRFRGSSGGMFETVAKWVLSQNGRVFASKFDDDLNLRMFEATTEKEVKLLTKSKYLQSDAAPCFPIVKERVRQGVPVFVCSTPCQIAALKEYLGGSYAESNNLYLMDFFCHGVPSQAFFNKCMSYVEKIGDIKITEFEFRSKKKNGATPHYYTLKFRKNGQDQQKTRLYLEDQFYLGFQKYLTLRDSCYHCPYGSGNHAGDITVGDFHEIDRYVKGVNRFDGVSTVIINSDKGKKIWDAIRDTLIVHEVEIDRLLTDRQIYVGSTPEPGRRSEFIKDLEELPFELLVKKWLNSRHEWKKSLYYKLPALVRKVLKSVFVR